MDVNTAVEITESLGGNLVYNKILDLYTLYFGESWCYIKPTDFEAASEYTFKGFLLRMVTQEAEQINIHGITRH